MAFAPDCAELVGITVSLGDRLLQWLDDLSNWLVARAWWKPLYEWTGRLNRALGNVPGDPLQSMINQLAFLPVPGAQIMVIMLAAFTGKSVPLIPDEQTRMLKLLYTNPTQYFIDVARQIGNNPAVMDVSNQLGDMMVTFVMAPLDMLLDRGNVDPQSALKLVVGRLAAINLSVSIVAVAAETTGLGQLESVATMLAKVVDTLDLQGIMHEVIRPITQHGYYEFARRYYQRKYRPGRFSAGDYMSLYSARRLTSSEFYDRMADQGYPDSEIDDALFLAEQKPSVGDALDAYNLGIIGLDRLVTMLHERGYSADAVTFLVQLNDKRQQQADLNSIASEAFTAYKKAAISEADFRRIRASAGIPQERIELEVQVTNLSRQADKTDLTIGSIHNAYLSNVLARVEADKYLSDNGVDADARRVLLLTWDEEKSPKVLRLNSGTIIGAFSSGIFTYDEALKKLVSVGWGTDDANVMLEIARKRMSKQPRQLSELDIVGAYINGLLNYDEAVSKLVAIGLTDNDAKLVIELRTLSPQTTVRNLSEARVIKLLALGVFDEDEAIRRLVMDGYDEQTAQLAIIADTSGSLTSILTKKVQE